MALIQKIHGMLLQQDISDKRITTCNNNNNNNNNKTTVQTQTLASLTDFSLCSCSSRLYNPSSTHLSPPRLFLPVHSWLMAVFLLWMISSTVGKSEFSYALSETYWLYDLETIGYLAP
jgi:hypothetical protein